MSVRVLIGDVRDKLKELADESVHCVVTSPPYWGLRDYGTAMWEGGAAECDHAAAKIKTRGDYAYGSSSKDWDSPGQASDFSRYRRECDCGARRIDQQLGLESTYQEHVTTMADIFDEVRRVLRKDGTLWLNYGDSYAGSTNRQQDNSTLKPKDLCGIPWRVAFALQDRGWWLRQDIIWAKPNPMPESVTDRCTKAHEYVFLLAKSPRYYFDAEAISEPLSEVSISQIETFRRSGESGIALDGLDKSRNDVGGRLDQRGRGSRGAAMINLTGRNRRSVWTIATAPYSEAHFATFPPELAELCIKAGTSQKGCCGACGAPWVRDVEQGPPEGRRDHGGVVGLADAGMYSGRAGSRSSVTLGWSPSCQCNAATIPCTVLNPFGGAGTTGMVADRLQRHAIMIELNPAYAAMAQERLNGDRGGLLDLMEAAQ